MVSGMTGDHSILLAKSILDLPTSLIFACTLGMVTSFIAVPQMLIFLLLFTLAKVIYPYCAPEMIGDFSYTWYCYSLTPEFVSIGDWAVLGMIDAPCLNVSFSVNLLIFTSMLKRLALIPRAESGIRLM